MVFRSIVILILILVSIISHYLFHICIPPRVRSLLSSFVLPDNQIPLELMYIYIDKWACALGIDVLALITCLMFPRLAKCIAYFIQDITSPPD